MEDLITAAFAHWDACYLGETTMFYNESKMIRDKNWYK